MLYLRLLSTFELADEKGQERPFEDYLADFNFILVTHAAEATHRPATELFRSLAAVYRSTSGASVCGINIQSTDGFCGKSRRPHVIFTGRRSLTICDSGGLIRRLWGVEANGWILVATKGRNVLHEGPFADLERLAMRLSFDIALRPDRTARAPPERHHANRRDSAA